MAKKKRSKYLSTPEVEALFATVDETGHSNANTAEAERGRRAREGVGLRIDPLSGKDPSGSNVGNVIARTSVLFVLIIFAVVVGSQIFFSITRRVTTTALANHVDIQSVNSALRNGVEWGDGFTGFPEHYTVQEASEETGRVEVTVIDITSETAMSALSTGYIQATAFATNALLNPNISTVIYHIDIHEEDGKIQTTRFFGLLEPTGPQRNFLTFVFTKVASADGGINFFCSISGLDDKTAEALRAKVGNTTLEGLLAAPEDSSTLANSTAKDAGASGQEGAAGQDAAASGSQGAAGAEKTDPSASASGEAGTGASQGSAATATQ